MWKPLDHQNLDHHHGLLLLVLITRASDTGDNTSVLNPTTTWLLPTDWQPNSTNCGTQLTLVSKTTLVPATITLALDNTQISV